MLGKCRSHLVAALACAAFVGFVGLPIPASQLGLGGTAASAEESIDINYFYDKLAPHGQWIEHPRFGYVWLPQNVSEDWRPYTVGHWVNTKKYGWYWESEEPFAWAVYHYGRWSYDTELGWFWVPGTIWAPAWVEWRYPKKASKKGYVGWAPVGPQRSGYAYGVEDDYEPPIAEAWVFVEPEYIIAEDVYVYAVPVADIDVDYIETTIVYQPRYRGGIVYNTGIPHDRVEAVIGRQIETREVVRVEDPSAVAVDGDKVQAFAPRVEKAKPGMMPQNVAKSPDEFKPKAKLKAALKEAPKELGPTASELKPAVKEGTFKQATPGLDAEREPGAPGKLGRAAPSSDELGEKAKTRDEIDKKKEPGAISKLEERSGPGRTKKGKDKGDLSSAEQALPSAGPMAPKGKRKGEFGRLEQPSAPSGRRAKPRGEEAMIGQDGPSSSGLRKGRSARSSPMGEDGLSGPSRRSAIGQRERGGLTGGGMSGGPGGSDGDRRRGPREPG
jgi:hypothetical protein